MHFGHPDKYRQVGFLPLTAPTEPPTTRNEHFLRPPGNHPTCKPTHSVPQIQPTRNKKQALYWRDVGTLDSHDAL
jgi:hypothetical protein